jgi:hypothetical protein
MMSKKRGGCKGGGKVPDGLAQVPDGGPKCGAEHGCEGGGTCKLNIAHEGKHKCDIDDREF